MEQDEIFGIRRREPVVVQVHQALRRAILEGRFAVGERLIETELADRMGVSRTPIREALSKLEMEGLVESLPVGGVVVRDLEAEFAEIYGLRQRLEGYAAHLAAQRRTPEELEILWGAARESRNSTGFSSPERGRELNNNFHRLLIEASHSPRVIRLCSDLRDYFIHWRLVPFNDRETAIRHNEQHLDIVAAVESQDGDEAERLIGEHFASALRSIQASLQRMRSEPAEPAPK